MEAAANQGESYLMGGLKPPNRAPRELLQKLSPLARKRAQPVLAESRVLSATLRKEPDECGTATNRKDRMSLLRLPSEVYKCSVLGWVGLERRRRSLVRHAAQDCTAAPRR